MKEIEKMLKGKWYDANFDQELLVMRQKAELSIPLSEVHAICYRSPHNPLKKSIFFKS